MVLTLNIVHGFEHEDINSALYNSVGGSPSIQSSVVRTGTYAAHCAAAATIARISLSLSISDNKSSAGTDYIIGVAVRFTDVTPGSNVDFLQFRVGGSPSDVAIGVRLKTDGDIGIINAVGTEVATATPSLAANQWYYFELYHHPGS